MGFFAIVRSKVQSESDMGIDEMRDVERSKSVREQRGWLEGKQREINGEIERLRLQSARIEELKKFYAFADDEGDRVGEVDMLER